MARVLAVLMIWTRRLAPIFASERPWERIGEAPLRNLQYLTNQIFG
jgi:hypothetical protein